MDQDQFKHIWTEYFDTSNELQIDIAFSEIKNHHSEPHRHYHNWNHIEQILGLIDLQNLQLTEREILIHAAIFHDVIYKPGSSTNEKDSAVYAQQVLLQLKKPPSIIQYVTEIILATEKHQSTDPLVQLFLDMDMSILGSPPKDYEHYQNAIRQEHKNIPSTIYSFGRKRFLKNTLKQKRIFLTDFFHQKLEEQARINLQFEIGKHGLFHKPDTVTS